MTQPASTVQPSGPGVTEGGAGPSAPAGGRFTYPSGSRPLEGFTIKRGIGHGGFGEVYYALSDGGKEVALKLIRRNLEVELRGIRHCLNLKHPNLLSIYDIRRDQAGDNWVVMEYVTGQSLEEVIAAHGRGMPQDEALAWFGGIAAGVACLHDHGIVHRDLKPGNVFCDQGVVKLGDYGLSKFISCSRRSGQTESVGTVHYMAPEIANGRYGKEIDIYALGVILYEMLTGRVPFEGESVGEVLMKHLTTPPDVSMLAEPFRSVIARALEKDPARRFASVPEMLAALPRPARAEVHMGPLPSATRRPKPQGASAGSGASRADAAADNIREEPVLRAVCDFCRRSYEAWNRSRLNTPTKAVILVLAAVLLGMNVAWLSVAAGVVLVVYACYFTVRAVVLGHQARRAARPGGPAGVLGAVQPAGSTPQAGQGEHPIAAFRETGSGHAPGQRPRWAPRRLGRREQLVEALLSKPPRQRLAELFGSLIGGALVALVMALVMLLAYSFRESAPGAMEPWGLAHWTRFAWLAGVIIAGAWSILIPSKFWEGTEGDAMLRRFILMVVGLGVGLLAFAALDFLNAQLPHEPRLEMFPSRVRLSRDLGPGAIWPAAKYSVAAFGALFFLVRWWRLADPLRLTRLSLWSLMVCGLLAWVIADCCGFPQPWLPMAACGIAVSVQLSSPWQHPHPYRLRP